MPVAYHITSPQTGDFLYFRLRAKMQTNLSYSAQARLLFLQITILLFLYLPVQYQV
jgi:hypothetical protein